MYRLRGLSTALPHEKLLVRIAKGVMEDLDKGVFSSTARMAYKVDTLSIRSKNVSLGSPELCLFSSSKSWHVYRVAHNDFNISIYSLG